MDDPRVAKDLSDDVRAVLERVPEKYRSVLILRDLENFSSSEVAAIMDRKEATIRWRLAEARNRFAELWKARLAEADRIQSDQTGGPARRRGPRGNLTPCP